ncbi:energy transducer TonB [Aquitalea sp. S1-19]|nr:energy transducer TonB [Aquitalea sp. S1-19]
MLIKKSRVLLPLALSLLLHALFVAFLPSMQAQQTQPPLQLDLLALPSPGPGTPAPAATKAAPLPARAPGRTGPKTATAKSLPEAARASVRSDLALPAPPTKAAPASPPPASTSINGTQPAATGASAAQAADAGSGPGSAAGFSGANWRAGALDNPAPSYPERSRERGEEGRVVLRVEVGADGRVRDIAILQSSGFPRLDRAARDAVERWRFTPARRGNSAVADRVDVPIRFRQTD